MSLAGGIILFQVALLNIIQQFEPPKAPQESIALPSLQTTIYPLAFPTIVTPYGIAAVIVFFTLSPDLPGKLTIGAIMMGIMVRIFF